MASTYKPLAQAYPAAATLTDAYTVPALTQAVVSRIMVCNLTGTATVFRIAIAPAGAASANQHFIFMDNPIGPNETIDIAMGAGLQPTDKVRVYSGILACAFNIFGVELT